MTWQWMDDWLTGLIHRSIQGDPAEYARQERFVIARTATAMVSFVALPPSLLGQASSELLAGLAVLTLAPLASVFILSRWGRLDAAQVLVSAALTLLIVHAVASSGMPLVPWGSALFAVALDALAIGSRRGRAWAGTFAVLGLPLTALLQADGLSGDADVPLLAIGAFTAAVAIGHGVAWLRVSRDSAALPEPGVESCEAQTLAALDDLVTWHDRNGCILRCNGASVRLLGADPSSIHGNGLFSRIHVGDRPLFLRAVSDVAHGIERARARFRVRTGDTFASQGAFIWIEMHVHRLVRDGDAPCAAVAVMRDISEHMQRTEELEALRHETQSTRESRAELLATVSHELRTPLEAILGYSEILMGKGALSLVDRREDYPGIIRRSGQHMLGAVDALLDLSTVEAGHYGLAPEPLDVAGLVRDCCDLMAVPARQSGVVLEPDLAASLPEIVGDRRACRQILINLLSNAVRSTPSGGRVSIDVRRESDGILLAVRDMGVGVPEGGLPRLGRLCDRGPARPQDGKGSGLSLAVVRGLVELHRGQIQIAGAPGNGTCVRVVLPLDAREHGDAKTMPKTLAAMDRRPESEVIVLKTG